MPVPPVQSVSSSTNLSSTGVKKEWSDLTPEERINKSLDIGFKFGVAPLSIASSGLSVLNFFLSNVFKSESESLDKINSFINKVAYFLTGVHGSIGNAFRKDTFGSIGYSLVSLSSIIGNDENMYLLKGFGSALDQMPAMMEDMAFNPKIKSRYELKDGHEKGVFNEYKGYVDSTKKTLASIGVVCSDVYHDLKEKSKKGFFTALKEIFYGGERTAEKNLVVSAIGILTGAIFGTFLGFNNFVQKIGASIRDIFGIHADIALWDKGDSKAENGQATAVGNIKYKLSGAFYLIASAMDLVYRWTGLSKLNMAAVGIDALGFSFMTWASSEDNKAAMNNKNGKHAEPAEQETRQPTPAPSPVVATA
ncbi:MAG: hypothetical protein HYY52_05890 [Candidatus Melainabacteria bacterium]|nr:hypothetical protein [Candidatus Melainabacteria bacterium]